MRAATRMILTARCAVFLGACGTQRAVKLRTAATGAATQDALSAQQAKTIVRDSYVFTHPLVMNYRTIYMQAIKGDGRFGKWLQLGLSSPADTDIVTPNNSYNSVTYQFSI